MARLDASVQLLALALLNYADDEGYFRAESQLVRAACCPFMEPSVSVHDMLTELEGIGWIETRKTAGGEIGRVATWGKHQRINRPSPSKLKSYWLFTEDSVNSHGCLNEDSGRLHGRLMEGSLPEQGTGKGKETPIVPLSGDGLEGVLHLESPALSSPSGELELQRAKALFRMRPGSALDAAGERAWKRARKMVCAATEEEWVLLEAYYQAQIPKRDDYRRRDLSTLLNHWQGEVVRAGEFCRRTGLAAGPESTKKEKRGAPCSEWKDVYESWAAEKYGAGERVPSFERWEDVPGWLQDELHLAYAQVEQHRAEEQDGRAA